MISRCSLIDSSSEPTRLSAARRGVIPASLMAHCGKLEARCERASSAFPKTQKESAPFDADSRASSCWWRNQWRPSRTLGQTADRSVHGSAGLGRDRLDSPERLSGAFRRNRAGEREQWQVLGGELGAGSIASATLIPRRSRRQRRLNQSRPPERREQTEGCGQRHHDDVHSFMTRLCIRGTSASGMGAPHSSISSDPPSVVTRIRHQ